MKLRGDPRFFRDRPVGDRLVEFPVGGGMFVLVHAALIVLILTIYLSCTAMADGSLATIWIVPHRLGLSLYAIATLVHLLLFAVLLGAAALSRWKRRGRIHWQRVIKYVFIFCLLAGTQAVLNGWKRTAELHLEWRATRQRLAEERIMQVRAEIELLGDHPWAGEYLGARWFGDGREAGEAHYWFAPKAGLAYSWHAPSDSEELHFAQRILNVETMTSDLVVDGDILRQDWGQGREQARREPGFVPATWGDRQYLVRESALAEFRAAVNASNLEAHHLRGVLLRASDREKPVYGAARFGFRR